MKNEQNYDPTNKEHYFIYVFQQIIGFKKEEKIIN